MSTMSAEHQAIIDAAAEAGYTSADVARGLAAAESATRNYPTLCAQTPLIALDIIRGKKTAAAIAEEAGVSAMQVGRYNAAGRILLAHPDLDAVAVQAFANDNTKTACKAIEKMSAEDASDAIDPKAKRGPSTKKTAEERDLAAAEAFLKRIRNAGDARELSRVEALDAIVTSFAEAIAEAYAMVEMVEEIEEEVA